MRRVNQRPRIVRRQSRQVRLSDFVSNPFTIDPTYVAQDDYCKVIVNESGDLRRTSRLSSAMKDHSVTIGLIQKPAKSVVIDCLAVKANGSPNLLKTLLFQ